MGQLWRKSGTVEFDQNGDPADGATTSFFQGGTTTPLTVYQDAAEATPHANPVEADGNGRWPDVFIPFCTSYDETGSTSGGTELWYTREIPNLDPVTAAGDTVDVNALIATGDIIFSPKTGTRSGFVRVNGRTIGSASSGATERANADCSDLYAFNWNNFADAILPVTGGRGASAAADFAANKPIALLDGRSAVLRGVDDMGNTAGSYLGSAAFVTGDALTGGSIAGANSVALIPSNTPPHTHGVGSFAATSNGAHTHGAGTLGADAAGVHTHSTNESAHSHGISPTAAQTSGNTSVTAGGSTVGAASGTSATDLATTGITLQNAGNHTHTISGSTASDGAHTHTISGISASTGGGTSSTVTMTIASPGVISWASHGLAIDAAVIFTTTGTLPTGITAGSVYYIISAGFGANSFRVSGSIGGSVVNTSGSQSGTHTATNIVAHNNVSRSILGNHLQKL